MSIIYGIISIPVFLGVLWWIFNLIFSPIIVASNVLNEFFPTVKVEKSSNTSEKPSNISEKLSYDPKYAIEDLFRFEEEVSKLQEGDLIFEDDKVYRFTKE